MSIVSSTHTLGAATADGHRWVTEMHTDHLGNVYTAEYFAAPGTDYQAIRGQRAGQIEADLAAREIEELLGD